MLITSIKNSPDSTLTQWAEYYRSVGKVKEAEAIEDQMRTKAPIQPQQLGAPGQPQYGAVQYGQQPQYY